jgi:methylase of polypeptide subunit release factors
MRSLFILYLEDKGAAKEAGLYSRIKQGAESYFDILNDVDATYSLFDVLHEHFNGNVFPVTDGEQKSVTAEHLQKIKNCFIDGDASGNPKLFENWKIFDFSFIQIELLSEVYEMFLGELDEKKAKGQFYTPYPLVELMLNDKLPTGNETNHQVKILDIACGSGIFLVESYKRLIRRWKNANPDKKISFTELRDILTGNIFGIEINPLAIKVAAFSLYLALVEQLDPKTLWIKKEYRLPYLINNPDDPSLKDKQGKNLWRKDTIGDINAEKFIIKADLLVSNPPFGTDEISLEIKGYLNKRKYAQEKVLAFLDKASQFTKDDGKIALIFNTKVLTNTNKKYQNFRKWLFNKMYVEKIYNLSIFRKAKKDFGGQLFNSATVPVSIVYYQKEPPLNVSGVIEYCAPKTYVKSNTIDGLVIDSTDIKFLPRHECQKPDTKIWKIALWGNQQDFALLYRLITNNHSLASDTRWISGRGLNADKENPDFIPEYIITTKAIERYYTNENALKKFNEKYYRKNNDRLFIPPFIIVKEAQHNCQIAASLIDYEAYCTTGAFVINGNELPLCRKKELVAFINSDIVRYILFLTSSTWGIERERVCLLNELMKIPSILANNESEIIVQSYDNIINQLKSTLPDQQTILDNENIIKNELFKVLNISKKEQILIEDTLKYSLDLFEQGENSIGFHRTLKDENEAYANMICDELNDFYSDEKYKVNAVIYDVRHNDPLNIIVLHFCDTEKPVEIKTAMKLMPLLKKLNRYSIREKGKNIYVQKQFRYYDNDTIYLIKPNQKRFWTRSQAIDDAMSLIVEIAGAGGEE